MFITILLLLSALGLSSIAGYYSVIGMTAIFASTWWPIVIMTGMLEFSKLVVASWLYRNWNYTPLLLRSYLTIAVVVLMFITSLGIFGYLSKAHIDQGIGQGDNTLFLAQIDREIQVEKNRIDDTRKIISQMDDAVSSILSQSVTASAQKANRGSTMAAQASQLRDRQKKDRELLNKGINESNLKIRDLSNQKLKLEQEQLKIEAEVGPIKYIAQMIYGDNPDKNLLEKAVRYVTILIIFVFDPLAVLMVIAANMSMAQISEAKRKRKADSAGPIVVENIQPLADLQSPTLPLAVEQVPEENPVEEKVTEEKVTEEKPVEEEKLVEEEKPVEEKPVEEKPVEEKLVEEKPSKEDKPMRYSRALSELAASDEKSKHVWGEILTVASTYMAPLAPMPIYIDSDQPEPSEETKKVTIVPDPDVTVILNPKFLMVPDPTITVIAKPRVNITAITRLPQAFVVPPQPVVATVVEAEPVVEAVIETESVIEPVVEAVIETESVVEAETVTQPKYLIVPMNQQTEPAPEPVVEAETVTQPKYLIVPMNQQTETVPEPVVEAETLPKFILVPMNQDKPVQSESDKESDDILQTIEQYHNVRLEDAKRNLK